MFPKVLLLLLLSISGGLSGPPSGFPPGGQQQHQHPDRLAGMRYLVLVLLLGCVTEVERPNPPDCKRGIEYEWSEYSGRCGPFAEVVAGMSECPATLASSCLWRNDYECSDGTTWTWFAEADGGVEHVIGPHCESLYRVTPR